MKNYLFLLVSCLIIASCNSVEQYRAPIESLTAEWSKAGEGVKLAAGNISTSANFLNNMVDSFMIDSTKKWNKLGLDTMNMMKTAFMAQVQGINNLSTDINDFTNKWATLTADVDALSMGLKNGKLEGDVMAKINDLKANCAMAATQTEQWNKNMMGAQATAVNAWELFKKAKMMK